MDIQRWIAQQQPKWQQLERLLNRAERKGLRHLSAQELQQLSSLYRMVSADLARSRIRQGGSATTRKLQQLALRGYAQVYQGKRRQDWREVANFWRWGFPAVVQQTWMYTLMAIALFGLGALIGWWYSWRDPAFLSLVVPESIISMVRDQGKLWMGSIVGIEPLASSQIMTNNLSVTFSTFAGGILAGLGTLYILWTNGLHLGAIATLVGQNQLAYPFWAFVFPHGALELPAIFLSGGAGLLLARGLLFPGRLRRLEALRQCGGQAIQLMFGVVGLLIVAGVIEGFFSPNPLVPAAVKYLAGVGLLWGLLIYLKQKPLQKT